MAFQQEKRVITCLGMCRRAYLVGSFATLPEPELVSWPPPETVQLVRSSKFQTGAPSVTFSEKTLAKELIEGCAPRAAEQNMPNMWYPSVETGGQSGLANTSLGDTVTVQRNKQNPCGKQVRTDGPENDRPQ